MHQDKSGRCFGKFMLFSIKDPHSTCIFFPGQAGKHEMPDICAARDDAVTCYKKKWLLPAKKSVHPSHSHFQYFPMPMGSVLLCYGYPSCLSGFGTGTCLSNNTRPSIYT